MAYVSNTYFLFAMMPPRHLLALPGGIICAKSKPQGGVGLYWGGFHSSVATVNTNLICNTEASQGGDKGRLGGGGIFRPLGVGIFWVALVSKA